MHTPTPSPATPLQRTLAGAAIAESVAADFKKDTWTFKVPAHQRVTAGRYVLLPVVIAELAIAQEKAEAADAITLKPCRNGRASYVQISGQPALEIEYECGTGLTLYRQFQPPKAANRWNPAHWWGIQSRVDQFGERWDGPFRRYVQDDFGTLVEVAA